MEFYLVNSTSIAKLSCASRTCKHVTGPIKPDELWICEHSPNQYICHYLLEGTNSQIYPCECRTYIYHFVSATTFQCIPFKVSRSLSEVATNSTAPQSSWACDWLKFQAAPASGDLMEGWIHRLWNDTQSSERHRRGAISGFMVICPVSRSYRPNCLPKKFTLSKTSIAAH